MRKTRFAYFCHTEISWPGSYGNRLLLAVAVLMVLFSSAAVNVQAGSDPHRQGWTAPIEHAPDTPGSTIQEHPDGTVCMGDQETSSSGSFVQTPDMELNYVNIKSFMERYFRGYGEWVESENTIDELDNFYTSDFTSSVYAHMEGKDYPVVRAGRQAFKDSLVRLHADVAETMTPKDIMIDEKTRKAVALVKIEMTNKKTKTKLEVDMAAIYQLCLDYNNTIKFESVGVFLSQPQEAMAFYFRNP